MKKILDSQHAEVAPPLGKQEECWYLLIFGVYHSKKPGQIRGVFDSSAQFDGISLNNVLLSGPDLMNSLLGVLLRFRREFVAITADIEQMFHCFHVGKTTGIFSDFCGTEIMILRKKSSSACVWQQPFPSWCHLWPSKNCCGKFRTLWCWCQKFCRRELCRWWNIFITVCWKGYWFVEEDQRGSNGKW